MTSNHQGTSHRNSADRNDKLAVHSVLHGDAQPVTSLADDD